MRFAANCAAALATLSSAVIVKISSGLPCNIAAIVMSPSPIRLPPARA
jgi:hypothetical protein